MILISVPGLPKIQRAKTIEAAPESPYQNLTRRLPRKAAISRMFITPCKSNGCACGTPFASDIHPEAAFKTLAGR
jgi:hypothetical protein